MQERKIESSVGDRGGVGRRLEFRVGKERRDRRGSTEQILLDLEFEGPLSLGHLGMGEWAFSKESKGTG